VERSDRCKVEPDPGDGQHFAGVNTQSLLRHLYSLTRPGLVEDILRVAGEPRSPAELMDDGTWSTYDQFRRLLEASAEVLGGTDELRNIGRSMFTELSDHDYMEILQALGSPAALYANLNAVSAPVMRVVGCETEEAGETSWIIRQHMHAGFDPFPELCAFIAGLVSVTPKLFGYPPAEVVEETCQCHGAPECVFRVTWRIVDEATRKAEYFEMRTHVLEGRLDALQRTVGFLVSGDDVEEVLSRIVASAALTARAPSYVLALEGLPSATRNVYAHGIAQSDAERVAADLLSGQGDEQGRLVVEVRSTHRAYGHLAAIDPSGASLLAQTAVVLEAYGRLAAAALDSATALDQARREAATARAMLELSSALAEVGSVDETAEKLARSIPAVVDCDHCAIFLINPATGTAHASACEGFTEQQEAALRALTIEVVDHDGSYHFRERGSSELNPHVKRVMQTTGDVAYSAVAIMGGGTQLGFVAVSVTNRPERIRSADVGERLRGLAAQAASAIRNARLLDQIRHEALHDALTGLPNRALINDRIIQMQTRARRTGLPSAALFIDLDGFKAINDTLGHEIGDQVLKAVAARLRTTLRDSDTVGRLGGDEFIALVDGETLDAGPELVAERLLEVLRQPLRVAGHLGAPLTLTASVGIAVGDRVTPGELLRNADVALHQAKGHGKNCAVLFEPEMQTALRHRLELEMDLREAIDRRQLYLVYQPVYDLASARIVGVEALLRWMHPIHGVVSPMDFIPILEETGMIVEVGRRVLHEACRQAATWHQAGHPLNVSVNVSARQLDRDSFIDDVRAALTDAGLQPHALTIEVTETALMRDVDATARRLRAVKAIGASIAIDDFGTGHSSLAYLRQFPVDALKIDRSFVSALGVEEGAHALIRTFVELGRSLGLLCVAEGIETEAQADCLRLERCELAQGFLFARPLPVEDLEHLLWDPAPSDSIAANPA